MERARDTGSMGGDDVASLRWGVTRRCTKTKQKNQVTGHLQPQPCSFSLVHPPPPQTMDEIANSFRLNVTAVSESCNREILQHSSDDAGKDNGRTVVIWNRKDDLTKDVYLEESQSGQLRVVKQVTTTDKSINYRSEIDLMGRISRATEYLFFLVFYVLSIADTSLIKQAAFRPIHRVVPVQEPCLSRDGILPLRRPQKLLHTSHSRS